MATATALIGNSVAEEVQNTNNNQVQGGAGTALGAAASANSVTTGAGGQVTINQESPQATAALLAGFQAYSTDQANTALGALQVAHGIASDANDLASKSTDSPLQTLGRVAIPIVLILAVVAAAYFYKKG